MSVLYNRLKSAEKDKRPDAPLDEREEFPIDGEIKRQKEERWHTIKLGIRIGIMLFIVVISVGVGFIAMKKDKPSAKKKGLPSKPVVKVEKPLPAPKKVVVIPDDVVDLAKTPLEQEETPVELAGSTGELFEQGTQLFRRNKYNSAANAYVAGLQKNPQQPVGYNNLGVVYFKQGKLKKSLSQLKLAVELDSQYTEAHFNLAVVLEKMNQDKLALAHYLKFVESASKEQKELKGKVKTHIRHYY